MGLSLVVGCGVIMIIGSIEFKRGLGVGTLICWWADGSREERGVGNGESIIYQKLGECYWSSDRQFSKENIVTVLRHSSAA